MPINTCKHRFSNNLPIINHGCNSHAIDDRIFDSDDEILNYTKNITIIPNGIDKFVNMISSFKSYFYDGDDSEENCEHDMCSNHIHCITNQPTDSSCSRCNGSGCSRCCL